MSTAQAGQHQLGAGLLVFVVPAPNAPVVPRRHPSSQRTPAAGPSVLERMPPAMHVIRSLSALLMIVGG